MGHPGTESCWPGDLSSDLRGDSVGVGVGGWGPSERMQGKDRGRCPGTPWQACLLVSVPSRNAMVRGVDPRHPQADLRTMLAPSVPKTPPPAFCLS